MPKLLPLLAAATLLGAAGCAAPSADAPAPATSNAAAPPNPLVGGAVMDPAAPLSQNVAKSREHGTLTSAIRSAGLEATLGSAGPYTFFAPTDLAFARLPNGTMTTLADPANRSLLGQLLRYHLVVGAKTRTQIAADLRSGGGVATYRTIEGDMLRISMTADRITITDIHGNRNTVTISDVRNSNGVMHVVDGVLLPAF